MSIIQDCLMKNEKQREYFRLKFPVSYRPSFLMGPDSYKIVDVSEYGMKLKLNQFPVFTVKDNVRGAISFLDGAKCNLSGQVVRIEPGFAGLHLSTQIPPDLIKTEALYIIEHCS
jgi:PilZ domain